MARLQSSGWQWLSAPWSSEPPQCQRRRAQPVCNSSRSVAWGLWGEIWGGERGGLRGGRDQGGRKALEGGVEIRGLWGVVSLDEGEQENSGERITAGGKGVEDLQDKHVQKLQRRQQSSVSTRKLPSHKVFL